MTFNSGGKKDPDGKMSPGELERHRQAWREQNDSQTLQRVWKLLQQKKEQKKQLSLAQSQDRHSPSSLTVQSRPVNGGGQIGRRYGYHFAPSKEQSASPPVPPAVIAARRAALFRSASEHRGYWEERAGYVEKCPDCLSALPEFCLKCHTALRDTCLACGVCPGCQYAPWKQHNHSVRSVADIRAGAVEDAANAGGGGAGGEEVPTFNFGPSRGHSNIGVGGSGSNTNAASTCTQALAPPRRQVSRFGAGKQALTVDADVHLAFSSPPRHTASTGGCGLANYASAAGDFRSSPSRAANGTFPDSTSPSASPPVLPPAFHPNGKMSPGELERHRQAWEDQYALQTRQRVWKLLQQKKEQKKQQKEEQKKQLSLAQSQDRHSPSSLTVQSRPVNGGGQIGRRYGYHFAPSKEQSASPPVPPAVIAARRAALFRSASEHRGYWEERAGYVEKCPDCLSALPEFCLKCHTALRDTCLACGVCPGCQYAPWKQHNHS